ncbi:unnamed protein product, partial [Rotaria socialis]
MVSRTSPIGERPLYFHQHIRWNFAIGDCLIGESLIGEHTATPDNLYQCYRYINDA